jgi:hypothetical protein
VVAVLIQVAQEVREVAALVAQGIVRFSGGNKEI